MEHNPGKAHLVEKITDCAFPFFANGYTSRAMYALALCGDEKKVGHRDRPPDDPATEGGSGRDGSVQV